MLDSREVDGCNWVDSNSRGRVVPAVALFVVSVSPLRGKRVSVHEKTGDEALHRSVGAHEQSKSRH